MASLSAVSCEGSSIPSSTMTSCQHHEKKVTTRVRGCVSRSLQANSALDDTTTMTPTIGGQISRLFETPIITTIVAAYCKLNKEGSTESNDLHKILVYSERAAIRLRHDEAKAQLSSLDSLTLEEIRKYQSYLRMEKAADVVKLCTSLKRLDLSHSDIDDTELRNLASSCPHLMTSLNLEDCTEITGYGLKPFASFPLTHLNLAGCKHLKDRDIKPFVTCPLVALNFADCDKLTDDGIKHFASRSSLTSVNLASCNRLTDGSILLFTACTQMTSLILADCQYLTDAIQVLATPTLRVLNLAGCNRLTNTGILPFAKLKQLTHVNLSFCQQLTDPVVIAFSACPSLISLNLAGCKKLTYDGIKHLAACKELSSLNLEYCNHFTIGRQALIAARPSLKVFI